MRGSTPLHTPPRMPPDPTYLLACAGRCGREAGPSCASARASASPVQSRTPPPTSRPGRRCGCTANPNPNPDPNHNHGHDHDHNPNRRAPGRPWTCHCWRRGRASIPRATRAPTAQRALSHPNLTLTLTLTRARARARALTLSLTRQALGARRYRRYARGARRPMLWCGAVRAAREGLAAVPGAPRLGVRCRAACAHGALARQHTHTYIYIYTPRPRLLPGVGSGADAAGCGYRARKPETGRHDHGTF